MPFDQPTRNLLARFVGEVRTLLTEEFTRQLQQEYGLDPERGEVTDLDRLGHLDDARRATALLLRETLIYYLAGQPKPDAKARREALDRIVREQAFTILNRLCALRMAEGRGLLIESAGQGHHSQGFQLYGHLAGTGLGETGDAYRCYLFSLFDELALELPVLFDRYAPEGRLFPREVALSQMLALINAPEIAPLWAEDETIGWIYQYFNSKEERQAMRAESQAPRNSRELAVRNQFFTPRYVVEFLTDNTLGRIWYEMTKGETSLTKTCRYLVRRPTEIFLAEGEEAPQQDPPADDRSEEELLRQPIYIPHRALKDPRDILMLDPACGSLHFGLYAFDLYERIYDEAWEMEERLGTDSFVRSEGRLSLHETYPDKASFLADVPRLIIERNIHGIDIDPRAVQIAGLSLWLRAQRSWQAQGIRPQDRPQIRRSNIVCAEPMPGDRALLEEFLKTLRDERLEGLIRRVLRTPANQRVRATPAMADALCDLVRTVWKEMELAGEAGSLLKIEEALEGAVVQGKAAWDEKRPLFRIVDFGLTEQTDGKPKVSYTKGIPGEDDADFWDRAEALVLAALEDYAEHAENGGGYRRRLFAGDAARGFAFIDLCRKHYDVVLMNPPFGEAPTACRNYLYESTPEAARDMFAGFVTRSNNMLVELGRLGVLSNRTAFFSDFLAEWRITNFLGATASLWLMADLGYGVLDAMVEAAAYICERSTTETCIFINVLGSSEKHTLLADHVAKFNHGQTPTEIVLRVLRSFLRLPDHRILYQVDPYWIDHLNLAGTHPLFLAKAGLTTGDDMRNLRLFWEVPSSSIRMRWSWLAKGGDFSRYRTNLHLLVDSHNQEFFHRRRNSELYRLRGVTYTERTTSNLSVRVLNEGAWFSGPGPGIIPATSTSPHSLLAYMNSYVVTYSLETVIGGGDFSVRGSAARHFEPGYMQYVPVIEVSEADDKWFEDQVSRLLVLLDEVTEDETDALFSSVHIDNAVGIRQNVLIQNRRRFSHLTEAYAIVESLEHKITHLLAIPADRVNETYSDTGWPWQVLDGRSVNHEDDLLFIDPLMPQSPQGVDVASPKYRFEMKLSHYLHQGIERYAAQTSVSPIAVCNILAKKSVASEDAVLSSVRSMLSVLVGEAMGRWDVRQLIDQVSKSKRTDPFGQLPICPPGMLQNGHGLPAAPADVPADYPLRISWPGILVDDPGHSEDIEARVRDTLRVIWPANADAIEQEACQILNVRTLREYFRKPALFFDDHLKRYSKSRRQAPIYWQLSTPPGAYTLWLYYHRFSDQTLYTCVNDFVDPKLKQVSDDAGRLRQKRGRSSADEKELERLAGLELELTDFRTELLRIAAFWKPNLNDGVQVTAAPLWRLFQHRPWQQTLKETWEKLEAGEYDWAHQAMSIWPERVVPKCVMDRSLAIAHNVEDLFWVEDGGRWRNLLTPDEELAEQKQRQKRPGRDQLRSGLAALTLGEGRGLRCEQVYEALATGKWDDLTPALLLWPERVAQKCWDDPLLAVTLKIDLPTKRTKAARERFIAERVAAGCPDLADALREALADRVDRFASLWAELARGDRDDFALALALWPDRVVDKCGKDVGLAEFHGLRRFLWCQQPNGIWRRRILPQQEVVDEVARRQRKAA